MLVWVGRSCVLCLWGSALSLGMALLKGWQGEPRVDTLGCVLLEQGCEASGARAGQGVGRTRGVRGGARACPRQQGVMPVALAALCREAPETGEESVACTGRAGQRRRILLEASRAPLSPSTTWMGRSGDPHCG